MQVLGLLVVSAAISTSHAEAGQLTGTIVGHTKQVIGSDGSRFAAWRPVSGASTTVLDVARHRVVSILDLAGCEPPDAVGAGALLYGCSLGRPGTVDAGWLKDLRTGIVRQVVPAEQSQADARQWIGVGQRWLQATDVAYHLSASRFFDRSNGAPYAGRSPFGPRRQPDLDRAGLVRRICAPLRAAPEPLPAPEVGDGYASLQFHGRFALNAGPSQTTRVGGPRLMLERCGSARRTALCPSDCHTPTFLHGEVVWADGVDVYAYRLADHRRRTYSLGAGAAVGVWRVGDRLLIAVDDNNVNEPSGLLTLRLVRLPS